MGDNRLIHLSFDDVNFAFEDITENRYKSIFSNKLFGFLKSMNEYYGLCCSLYCFYENENRTFNLSKCTGRFADELRQNRDWLKFGFHALNSTAAYDNKTAADITEDYSATVNELFRIAGGRDSLDTMPRLGFAKGNKECVRAIQNCENGISGLLGADDDRIEYYLSDENNRVLLENGYFYDNENNIIFYMSEKRLEHIEDIDTYLKSFIAEKKASGKTLIFFTHEHCFYKSEAEIKHKIEKICEYSLKNNYKFGFPSQKQTLYKKK